MDLTDILGRTLIEHISGPGFLVNATAIFKAFLFLKMRAKSQRLRGLFMRYFRAPIKWSLEKAFCSCFVKMGRRRDAKVLRHKEPSSGPPGDN